MTTTITILSMVLLLCAMPRPTHANASAIEMSVSSIEDNVQPKPVKVGEPAPKFTLKDLEGREHDLSKYRGKIVVLEWFNPECRFAARNHLEGPLRNFGNQCRRDGIVVLAINSEGKGQRGHGVELNKKFRAEFQMDYPVLIDEGGRVKKAYGAKWTPQIFIIDRQGILVYDGPVDNAPLGVVKPQGAERRIYAQEAIDDLQAGKAIRKATRTHYGCRIKSANK